MARTTAAETNTTTETIRHARATERGGASPLLALGLALITVFALALTVHLLVEKPALGAIRKGWKAHRAKAPAAANALV